ncbi:MAG: dihydrodipicolinate reductase [Dehalococcoidia bacterium]
MAAMTRVIVIGLGPIGQSVLALVADRPGLTLAGAVDIDPEKAGKDAGVVCGLDRALGVAVSTSLADALVATPADVALLCTGSYLEQVAPQVEEIINAGLNVVTTCEELAYAPVHNPTLAEQLDRQARERGVRVLGAGVNPGFAFDALVMTLSATCRRVTGVRAKRVLDAGTRRLPLQQKVGAGLSKEEFDALVAAGKVRHVGLLESLNLVADAFGWTLDRTEELTDGVIAARDVTTQYLSVTAGQVAGVKQIGRGYRNGSAVIELELQMYVGAPESYDAITIEGDPGIDMLIRGGIAGDPATTALTVNLIGSLEYAPPGLVTMKELSVHYGVGT